MMIKVEIRKLGIEEVKAGVESAFDCPIVFAGPVMECERWAKKEGLIWVKSKNYIFEGYWNNQDKSVSYIPV